jgi:Flp pilus assembly protein TadD
LLGPSRTLQKQSDRALSDSNQAIRLDPNSLQAYKLRGGILSGMGRRDQAWIDAALAKASR